MSGQKVVAWRFTIPKRRPAYTSPWYKYPDDSIPFHEARGQKIEYAYAQPAPDPLLDQASQEDIEVAARAMALVDGWDGWDTASGFNDTLSGNDPEDERAHYRDLANAALSAYNERVKG